LDFFFVFEVQFDPRLLVSDRGFPQRFDGFVDGETSRLLARREFREAREEVPDDPTIRGYLWTVLHAAAILLAVLASSLVR
jgi:hypothetical protein